MPDRGAGPTSALSIVCPVTPLRSKSAGGLVALLRVTAGIDAELRYVGLFVAAGVRLLRSSRWRHRNPFMHLENPLSGIRQIDIERQFARVHLIQASSGRRAE